MSCIQPKSHSLQLSNAFVSEYSTLIHPGLLSERNDIGNGVFEQVHQWLGFEPESIMMHYCTVRMYVLCGAYNYSGLVRQVSGFISVSISA